MSVSVSKMRQISDVEINDGIFTYFCVVFTIFSKNNPYELSTTSVIPKRFLSINPNKLSQKKEREITHSHWGKKSNYNYNT